MPSDALVLLGDSMGDADVLRDGDLR